MSLTVPRRRGHASHPGPLGEAPGSGGRRRKGKAWERAFIMVFVGRNEPGRVSGQAGLGLVSKNKMYSCLVPGPGEVRAGAVAPPVSAQGRRQAVVWALGWLAS